VSDEVTLIDSESVPDGHAAEVRALRGALSRVSTIARAERARKLQGGSGGGGADLVRRSRDWSEVRPEWGLAGNAAFIAAPRHRTRGLNLDGRAFLHRCSWRKDDELRTLELIMTAPMIVASWISLQYCGSMVDSRAFGSGNRVLHNVVGNLGVLEGNGGDLRPRVAVAVAV
jgi:uncharacterized protein YbcC (UPF0753/DUF2309 family)